jgi:hypothetical protein
MQVGVFCFFFFVGAVLHDMLPLGAEYMDDDDRGYELQFGQKEGAEQLRLSTQGCG